MCGSSLNIASPPVRANRPFDRPRQQNRYASQRSSKHLCDFLEMRALRPQAEQFCPASRRASTTACRRRRVWAIDRYSSGLRSGSSCSCAIVALSSILSRKPWCAYRCFKDRMCVTRKIHPRRFFATAPFADAGTTTGRLPESLLQRHASRCRMTAHIAKADRENPQRGALPRTRPPTAGPLENAFEASKSSGGLASAGGQELPSFAGSLLGKRL